MIELFGTISNIINQGKSVVLCSIVQTSGAVPRHAGSKMLVFPDGTTQGTVGGGEVEEKVRKEALEALKTGKPQLLDCSLMVSEDGSMGLCGGTVKVFIEPILPKDKIIIFGAGHVGKPIAHLAKKLGFHVVVSDDRPGICNKNEIPDADLFLEMPMEEVPQNLAIDERSYLVLVTRGSDVDIKGLPALLKTDAPYIGVMGSKKRWAHTIEGLNALGVTAEHMTRLKTPIGLDIKAENPEEIAVSVMAEIINFRNRM